jgi:hypothetical protein
VSELSTAAGNFAPTKYQIAHAGKTYCFKLVDGETLKEWETRRFNEALAALDPLRDRLSESAFEKRCDAVVARKEAGDFCFESRASQEFFKTPQGATFFLSLITGCDLAELVRLQQAKGPEARALLMTVVKESFAIKDKPAKPARKKSEEKAGAEAPLG